MIAEERAEAAVVYLRDTAAQCGQARGHLAYCEGNLRRIKALGMLSEEGSLGDREAHALASPGYLAALEALQNATAGYETIRALREAADLLIQVWRTQQSNQRQGYV